MEDYLDYAEFLNFVQKFAEMGMQTVNNVNTVFATSFDGSELGHPDYAGLPVTKGMAKAMDEFEKADKLHLKDENYEIIVTHWKRIFRAIREFQRSFVIEVPKLMEGISKARKFAIVPIRDYHNYRDYTKVMVTLATIHNGSATYEELASRHRDMGVNFEDELLKIQNIWKGLFIKEPVSGMYIMNEYETKQLQALINCNLNVIEASKEFYDSISTELAMYNYIFIPIVKDPVAKEFLSERWATYMNKPLSEFKGLISSYYLLKLNENDIYTGVDFLKTDFRFLSDNMRIKREDLIDITLGLCSRLKYFVREVSVRLVHPSCLEDNSLDSLRRTVSEITKLLGKGKEIKYADILRKREVLLHHKNVSSLENTYRVIAFIRYFNNRCLTGLPFNFVPLSKEWKFRSWLSVDEIHCMNKRYEKLDYERVKNAFDLDKRGLESDDFDVFIDSSSLDELEQALKEDEKEPILSITEGEEKVKESEEYEEE